MAEEENATFEVVDVVDKPTPAWVVKKTQNGKVSFGNTHYIQAEAQREAEELRSKH